MCSTPFDTGGAVVVDEGADELLPDPPIAVLLPPQAAATTRIAAGARRRTRNRGMSGTLGVPRGARAIRAERATWTSPAPKRAGEVHAVSYTHLRAHETRHDLVCRL